MIHLNRCVLDTRGLIVFNPSKPRYEDTNKPTNFEGIIYTSSSKIKQKKKIESLKDCTDCDEEICELYGDVLDELVVDGEQFWQIDRYHPYRFFPDPHCLPSDSRYREDLLWLQYGNLKYSQEWKSKLEVQQRHDKKLRLKHKKKK